jgi:IclR family transcriptional regulator, acetate operon repressor
MTDAMKDPLYPLASVDNALSILGMLARRAPIRLTDAALELGVAPSTAHRLLAMLEHRGFARRPEGGRAYVAGPSLEAMAKAITADVDLARLAQPVLEAVGRTYRESVLFGILADDGVRFIAGRESEQPLRVGGHFNQAFPPHASAGGLVLLAALNTEELRARYPTERLITTAPRAIARRSALERELAEVRARGFALVVETTAPGVSAVAVPFAPAGEKTSGTLTLIAPSSRFDVRKLRACVAPLRRASARLARDYRDTGLR